MWSEEHDAPGADVIPLSVPEFHGNEWRYVKECLDTGWVSPVGSFVDRFERELAARFGVQYAVATNSGTAALHIALLVAGVQPDDEVLVSALTFIAPANAVRYVGAWPIFIDAESEYWQMDPQRVEDFLGKECEWRNAAPYNKKTGRRVRAILPVHILGHPCDLDPILEMARKFDLQVVEDATESLGSRYKDRIVGHLGDIACFSFNGNKLITTGGGGMIVTDNEVWARRARYLTTQAKDDPVEFIHSEIGYNYRMSNILAAMGCGQLEHIDDHISSKRRIAAEYREALSDVTGITLMREATWAMSVFWLYTILVDPAQYGMDSRALVGKLGAKGIQSRPLWQPLYRSPAFAGSAFCRCDVDVADRLNREALCLPSSVGLSALDQSKVISSLRKFAC